MFTEIPAWIAVVALLGGGLLGTIIMCAFNLASKDRCIECCYVDWYQKFLRRLVDSKGEKIENVHWFSDELKRPSVGRAR